MRGLSLYVGLHKRRLDRETAPYFPSMDFSDARNSMYVALISAFCA